MSVCTQTHQTVLYVCITPTTLCIRDPATQKQPGQLAMMETFFRPHQHHFWMYPKLVEVVWHGMVCAWYGMVWYAHGMAWYVCHLHGMVWHMAWHSMYGRA